MASRSRSRSPRGKSRNIWRGQTDHANGLAKRYLHDGGIWWNWWSRLEGRWGGRKTCFFVCMYVHVHVCMSGRRVRDGDDEDDFTSVPFSYPSRSRSPLGAASGEQCLDEFFPICVNEIPRGREGIGYNVGDRKRSSSFV